MFTLEDLLKAKGRKVHAVTDTETVAECAREMTSLGVGSLVVTKGRTPVGIVTLRDIVRVAGHRPEDALRLPVAQIMTPSIETCEESTPLSTVKAAMLERQIRHMPVLREGEVVGLVTLLDVVDLHLKETATMSAQLEEYIYGPRLT